MLHQILIKILIFNYLINHLRTKEVRRYHCDSFSKINEIKNVKDNLIRLMRHDKNLYFVFKSRIIFTRLLDVAKGNGLIYNFYEQTNEEKEPFRIASNYTILGHFYRDNTNLTYEYYFIDKQINQTNQTGSEINDFCYQLDFNANRILGKRIKYEYTDKFLFDELKRYEDRKLKYLNVFDFKDNSRFILRFDYWD